MNQRFYFCMATCLLVVFSLLGGACAQSSRGTITGVVSDPSGAVVNGAEIALKNLGTNVGRSTATNASGIYRFDAVDLGLYQINVNAQGFAVAKLDNVQVDANRTITLDVALKVAEASGQAIDVEATGAVADLQRSEERRGDTISTVQLKELPVIGQNSLNLMLTLPGAVQSGLGGSLDSGIGSINGARTRSNNFLVDGVDNNDISVAGPVVSMTNNDAIQEVSIQTSNFSAEYGRAGGAVINQILKSGTNNAHGSAAWVYRSEVFDATTLPDRIAGASSNQTKPSYKENIPAFTIGGPVIIPHLYDGQNKTFFFVAGQWDRFSAAGAATFSNVPTTEGRAVLQSLASQCPNVALYLNALQGVTSPVDLAHAANIAISVPQSVFNATGSCTGTTRTGQTVAFGPANRTFPAMELGNNHQVRIDHNPSSRQFMSFRWLWNDFDGGLSAGTVGIAPLFDSSQKNRQFSAAFTHTYVISPSATNEFRVSYGRAHPAFPVVSDAGLILPRFTVSGISAFGTSPTFPQGRVSNNYQYQDTVALVRGKHSLRMGVELFRQLAKQEAPTNSRGTLAYLASGSGATGTSVSGLANFIDDFSGNTGNITQQFGSRVYRPNLFRWSLFMQDSWTATPTFTLNAGLRYENFGQPANIFQFPAYSGDDPTKFATPSHVPTANKNFGPSLGFAWSPKGGALGLLSGNGKTVVRGGYQLTYDTFFNNLLSNIAATAPNNPSNIPLIGSDKVAPRGLASLRGTLLGTVAVAPLNPLAGSSNQFAPNIVNPRYSHFSLGVQRELPRRLIMDVSYVGGLGRHLFQNLTTNPTTPAGPRINPAFGPRTIRASGATSNYHSLQLEVRNNLLQTFLGGLQFTSAYTWSRNMDQTTEVFTTNNQNSSFPSVNPYLFPNGLNADYAPSDNDRRHVWTTTGVWSVRGPARGFLGEALGGWTLSAILPVSSGQPYSVVNGLDRDLDLSSAADRPDIGNWNAPINSRAQITPISSCATGLINPDLGPKGTCVTANDVRWVQVASYHPANGRTASRNSVYTNGSVTMHLNVIKKFKLTERVGLEYRAEVFNLLNNQNFNFAPFLSGGVSTVDVTNAGQGNFLNFKNGNSSETIRTSSPAVVDSGRNMRMGLKLSF